MNRARSKSGASGAGRRPRPATGTGSSRGSAGTHAEWPTTPRHGGGARKFPLAVGEPSRDRGSERSGLLAGRPHLGGPSRLLRHLALSPPPPPWARREMWGVAVVSIAPVPARLALTWRPPLPLPHESPLHFPTLQSANRFLLSSPRRGRKARSGKFCPRSYTAPAGWGPEETLASRGGGGVPSQRAVLLSS